MPQAALSAARVRRPSRSASTCASISRRARSTARTVAEGAAAPAGWQRRQARKPAASASAGVPEQAHAIAARPARRARRPAEDARAGDAVDEASVDAPVPRLDGAPGGVRDGGGNARHDVSVADGPEPRIPFLAREPVLALEPAAGRPRDPRYGMMPPCVRAFPCSPPRCSLPRPRRCTRTSGRCIDVKSRLANDARVTVVETHDIVLETTGRNTFRTFGLGADQAIRLTALTRIGPDGEPHPLKAVETVTGPDEYRYYDRGHVYFSIPPLGERVAVQYRFEYQLIGAVTPAWAIAAGPGSRASDEQELFWPWERIGHVVADWRRAWPALTTRYRFDHDVLLPSREGPGHTFVSRLRSRVRQHVARHHADRGRRRGDAWRVSRAQGVRLSRARDPAAGHDGAGGPAARLAGGAADWRHPRLAARGGRGPPAPRPAD